MTDLVVQWMLGDHPSSHAGIDTSSLLLHPYPEEYPAASPHDHMTRKRKLSQEQDFVEALRLDGEESTASSLRFEIFKRQRMSEDERRARHREAQREFAVRKEQQLEEMRRLVQTLERQLQFLEVTKEIAQLEADNAKVGLQYRALDQLKFAEVAED